MLDLCAPPDTLLDFYLNYRQNPFKAASLSVSDIPVGVGGQKAGLTHIKADLAKPGYIGALEKWLGRDLLDFTTAFPVGAYYNLNNTWEFYFELTKWLVTHTNPDNGVILLETPPLAVFNERNMPLQRWLDFLGRNGTHINYLSSANYNDDKSLGILFIQRTTSSRNMRCER